LDICVLSRTFAAVVAKLRTSTDGHNVQSVNVVSDAGLPHLAM
jgi:hypothetical protein